MQEQFKNSRREALAAGETRYNGSPCKYGHGTVKRTKNYACAVCVKLLNDKHKKKKLAQLRKTVPAKKRGRPPTPDHLKIPRTKETIREYERRYNKKYPEKRKAKKAKYRASQIQRTPKWLTKEDMIAIEQIYALAATKVKETGTLWEVDHIIPLQGKNVSGLHVPSNLRVISREENQAKGNKFTVG